MGIRAVAVPAARGVHAGRIRHRFLSCCLLALGVLLALGLSLPYLLSRPMQPFAGKDTATLLIIGADKPQNGVSRSDTLLLVRIRIQPERRITLLSLPRDTCVQIPGRKGRHRLNSAFAFSGAALLRKTVEANFGVSPDYTVTLHPEGLA